MLVFIIQVTFMQFSLRYLFFTQKKNHNENMQASLNKKKKKENKKPPQKKKKKNTQQKPTHSPEKSTFLSVSQSKMENILLLRHVNGTS